MSLCNTGSIINLIMMTYWQCASTGPMDSDLVQFDLGLGVEYLFPSDRQDMSLTEYYVRGPRWVVEDEWAEPPLLVHEVFDYALTFGRAEPGKRESISVQR